MSHTRSLFLFLVIMTIPIVISLFKIAPKYFVVFLQARLLAIANKRKQMALKQ